MSAKEMGWKTFLKLCQSIEDLSVLDDLFQTFLSPEERKQISLRVELLRALLDGERPQRQISKDLKVSIATITRGSNLLKAMKPKFRKFLEEEL